MVGMKVLDRNQGEGKLLFFFLSNLKFPHVRVERTKDLSNLVGWEHLVVSVLIVSEEALERRKQQLPTQRKEKKRKKDRTKSCEIGR